MNIDIKKLIPSKAISELGKIKDKKIAIIEGEPGLLKNEIIDIFLKDKDKFPPILIEKKHKNPYEFIEFLYHNITKDKKNIPTEKMKSKIIKELQKVEQKYLVFKKVNFIFNSESFKIMEEIILKSSPFLKVILSSDEEIKVFSELDVLRIKKKNLLITEEDIKNFFDEYGITYDDLVIKKILDITRGYGIFVRIFVNYYVEKGTIPGKKYSEAMEHIFREKIETLDAELKSTILGLSVVERFSYREMREIIGIKDPEELLKKISEKFIFIEKEGDTFYIHPLFKDFLEKEFERHPRGIVLKKWILENAVEHYIEKGEILKSIYFLEKLGHYSKILELSRKHIFDFLNYAVPEEIEEIWDKFPEEFKKNTIWILTRAVIAINKQEFKNIKEYLDSLEEEKLDKELRCIYYLLQAGYFYYREEIERAFEILSKASEITKREELLFRLKNLEGALYFLKAKTEEAITSFKEALNLSKKIRGSKRPYVLLLTNLGSAYGMKGEFSKALEYLYSALNEAIESDRRAYIMKWIADILYTKGDTTTALAIVKEAYEEAKKSGRLFYLIDIYRIFRDITFYEKKFEEAKKYNEILKKLAEQFRESVTITGSMIFDAEFELYKNRNPIKAFGIIEKIENKEKSILLPEINTLMGKIYMALGEKEKAENKFKEALNLMPEESWYKKKILSSYFLFKYKTNKSLSIPIIKELLSIPEPDSILVILKNEATNYPFEINPEEVIDFIKRNISI